MGNIKVEEKMWSLVNCFFIYEMNDKSPKSKYYTPFKGNKYQVGFWSTESGSLKFWGVKTTTISEWSVFLFNLIISGEIGKVARSS